MDDEMKRRQALRRLLKYMSSIALNSFFACPLQLGSPAARIGLRPRCWAPEDRSCKTNALPAAI